MTCPAADCDGRLRDRRDAEGPFRRCDGCGTEFDYPTPNLNRDALAAALDPDTIRRGVA